MHGIYMSKLLKKLKQIILLQAYTFKFVWQFIIDFQWEKFGSIPRNRFHSYGQAARSMSVGNS